MQKKYFLLPLWIIYQINNNMGTGLYDDILKSVEEYDTGTTPEETVQQEKIGAIGSNQGGTGLYDDIIGTAKQQETEVEQLPKKPRVLGTTLQTVDPMFYAAAQERITEASVAPALGVLPEEMQRSGAHVAGKSLWAGLGDVVEFAGDVVSFTSSLAPGLTFASKQPVADGIRWLGNQMQKQGETYVPPELEDAGWEDLGNGRWWAQNFTRAVPFWVGFMRLGKLGYQGTSKLLNYAIKNNKIPKWMGKVTPMTSRGTAAQQTIGKGTGLAGLITTEKGMELVPTLGAGVLMNFIDGAGIAGSAAREWLDENPDHPNRANVAGEIAAGVWLRNAAWMGIDAAQWGLMFNPKLTARIFGKAGITKVTPEKMVTSNMTKFGKVLGIAGFEGGTEIFQETYQDWSVYKEKREADGLESEKFLPYFMSKDPHRMQTKMVSLMMGFMGGGSRAVVNSIYEDAYRMSKKSNLLKETIEGLDEESQVNLLMNKQAHLSNTIKAIVEEGKQSFSADFINQQVEEGNITKEDAENYKAAINQYTDIYNNQIQGKEKLTDAGVSAIFEQVLQRNDIEAHAKSRVAEIENEIKAINGNKSYSEENKKKLIQDKEAEKKAITTNLKPNLDVIDKRINSILSGSLKSFEELSGKDKAEGRRMWETFTKEGQKAIEEAKEEKVGVMKKAAQTIKTKGQALKQKITGAAPTKIENLGFNKGDKLKVFDKEKTQEVTVDNVVTDENGNVTSVTLKNKDGKTQTIEGNTLESFAANRRDGKKLWSKFTEVKTKAKQTRKVSPIQKKKTKKQTKKEAEDKSKKEMASADVVYEGKDKKFKGKKFKVEATTNNKGDLEINVFYEGTKISKNTKIYKDIVKQLREQPSPGPKKNPGKSVTEETSNTENKNKSDDDDLFGGGTSGRYSKGTESDNQQKEDEKKEEDGNKLPFYQMVPTVAAMQVLRIMAKKKIPGIVLHRLIGMVGKYQGAVAFSVGASAFLTEKSMVEDYFEELAHLYLAANMDMPAVKKLFEHIKAGRSSSLYNKLKTGGKKEDFKDGKTLGQYWNQVKYKLKGKLSLNNELYQKEKGKWVKLSTGRQVRKKSTIDALNLKESEFKNIELGSIMDSIVKGIKQRTIRDAEVLKIWSSKMSNNEKVLATLKSKYFADRFIELPKSQQDVLLDEVAAKLMRQPLGKEINIFFASKEEKKQVDGLRKRIFNGIKRWFTKEEAKEILDEVSPELKMTSINSVLDFIRKDFKKDKSSLPWPKNSSARFSKRQGYSKETVIQSIADIPNTVMGNILELGEKTKITKKVLNQIKKNVAEQVKENLETTGVEYFDLLDMQTTINNQVDSFSDELFKNTANTKTKQDSKSSDPAMNWETFTQSALESMIEEQNELIQESIEQEYGINWTSSDEAVKGVNNTTSNYIATLAALYPNVSVQELIQVLYDYSQQHKGNPLTFEEELRRSDNESIKEFIKHVDKYNNTWVIQNLHHEFSGMHHTKMQKYQYSSTVRAGKYIGINDVVGIQQQREENIIIGKAQLNIEVPASYVDEATGQKKGLRNIPLIAKMNKIHRGRLLDLLNKLEKQKDLRSKTSRKLAAEFFQLMYDTNNKEWGNYKNSLEKMTLIVGGKEYTLAEYIVDGPALNSYQQKLFKSFGEKKHTNLKYLQIAIRGHQIKGGIKNRSLQNSAYGYKNAANPLRPFVREFVRGYYTNMVTRNLTNVEGNQFNPLTKTSFLREHFKELTDYAKSEDGRRILLNLFPNNLFIRNLIYAANNPNKFSIDTILETRDLDGGFDNWDTNKNREIKLSYRNMMPENVTIADMVSWLNAFEGKESFKTFRLPIATFAERGQRLYINSIFMSDQKQLTEERTKIYEEESRRILRYKQMIKNGLHEEIPVIPKSVTWNNKVYQVSFEDGNVVFVKDKKKIKSGSSYNALNKLFEQNSSLRRAFPTNLSKEVSAMKDFFTETAEVIYGNKAFENFVTVNKLKDGTYTVAMNKKQQENVNKFVQNYAVTRYHAQQLISSQEYFNGEIDYVRRLVGPLAPFIPADVNSRIDPIIIEDTKSILGANQMDSMSFILEEDAAKYKALYGPLRDIGSHFKFVYYGQELENPNLQKHPFYFKTNVFVVSENLVKKNPKFRVIYDTLMQRKNHLQEQGVNNAVSIMLSQSSVKTATYNKGEKRNVLTEKEIVKAITTGDYSSINQQLDKIYFHEGEYYGIAGRNFGVQLELDKPKAQAVMGVQLYGNLMQNLTNEQIPVIEDILNDLMSAQQLYYDNHIGKVQSSLENAKNRKDIQLGIDNFNEYLLNRVPEGVYDQRTTSLFRLKNLDLPYLFRFKGPHLSKRVRVDGIRYQTPGGVAEQMSDFGFNGKGVDFDLGDKIGLLGYRQDPNNPNKMIPAQAMVPAYLKDLGYKVGDKFLGSRIPSDRKASHGVFEIVGFLEQEQGNAIAISSDMSKIFGSDLDGDSIFMNFLAKKGFKTSRLHHVDKSIPLSHVRVLANKLSKFEQNGYHLYNRGMKKLFDFFLDKKIQPELTTSIEFEKVVQDVRADLKKDGLLNEKRFSQYTPLGDMQMIANNVPQKRMIANVMSLHRMFNFFGAYGVSVDTDIFIDGKSKKSFRDKINKDGKGAYLDIALIANTIIDNPKHLFASDLGLVEEVVGHAVVLMRLGYSLNQVARIFNSDAGRIYIKNARARKFMGRESGAKTISDVLNNSLLEYVSKSKIKGSPLEVYKKIAKKDKIEVNTKNINNVENGINILRLFNKLESITPVMRGISPLFSLHNRIPVNPFQSKALVNMFEEGGLDNVSGIEMFSDIEKVLANPVLQQGLRTLKNHVSIWEKSSFYMDEHGQNFMKMLTERIGYLNVINNSDRIFKEYMKLKLTPLINYSPHGSIESASDIYAFYNNEMPSIIEALLSASKNASMSIKNGLSIDTDIKKSLEGFIDENGNINSFISAISIEYTQTGERTFKPVIRLDDKVIGENVKEKDIIKIQKDFAKLPANVQQLFIGYDFHVNGFGNYATNSLFPFFSKSVQNEVSQSIKKAHRDNLFGNEEFTEGAIEEMLEDFIANNSQYVTLTSPKEIIAALEGKPIYTIYKSHWAKIKNNQPHYIKMQEENGSTSVYKWNPISEEEHRKALLTDNPISAILKTKGNKYVKVDRVINTKAITVYGTTSSQQSAKRGEIVENVKEVSKENYTKENDVDMLDGTLPNPFKSPKGRASIVTDEHEGASHSNILYFDQWLRRNGLDPSQVEQHPRYKQEMSKKYESYKKEHNEAQAFFEKIYNTDVLSKLTTDELNELYLEWGQGNPLVVDAVTTEIALELANRHIDSQVKVYEKSDWWKKNNPDGKRQRGDIGWVTMWMSSNQFSSKAPEVNYVLRKIALEYKRYNREINRYFSKIQKANRKLIDSKNKERTGWEKLLLFGSNHWIGRYVNIPARLYKMANFSSVYRFYYGNLLVIDEVVKTDKAGNKVYNTRFKKPEVIESMYKNKRLSQEEYEYYQMYREMTQEFEQYIGEDLKATRQDYVPHINMTRFEAFSRRGLFGLYHTMWHTREDLRDIRVYSKNPNTGAREIRPLYEWEMIYGREGGYSMADVQNILEVKNLRSKARELVSKRQHEDGKPFQTSPDELRNMIDDGKAFNRFANSRSNKAAVLGGSLDINSALVSYVKSTLFSHGNDKFAGFNKMIPAVDAAIAYNREMGNKNTQKYLTTSIKEGFIKGRKQEWKFKPFGETGKEIDAGRIVDGMVKYVMYIGLGLNFPAAKFNKAIGTYNSIRMRGIGSWAKGEMRFWGLDKLKKGDVVGTLAGIRKSLGLLKNTHFIEHSVYDVVSDEQRGIIDDVMFVAMNASEKWIQGVEFLGMLTNEEWESYDNSGKLIKGRKGLSPERVAQLEFEVRKTQGRGYSATDQRMISMYSLGRAAMQFKRWLPTMINERLGMLDVDMYGQEQMGSVRAGLKNYKEVLKGKRALNALWASDKTLNQLSKGERDAILTFNRSYYALAFMLAMFMAWAKLWDDDDMFDRASYSGWQRFKGDAFVLWNIPKFKYLVTPGISRFFDDSTSLIWHMLPKMSEEGLQFEKYKKDSPYGKKGEWKGWGPISRVLPGNRTTRYLLQREYIESQKKKKKTGKGDGKDIRL